MAKNRGLGKGLASLLPSAQATMDGEAEITMLPVDRILPNPFQPRREINENTLAELGDSIKAHGVIQPLIVRRNEDGDYWIVAGERRWKAAKSVGLTDIPVRVIEATEMEVREISLIENIQREDLSPIDAALAISELIEAFDVTQEGIASRIGWSRAAIANKLRLLQLPDEIKILLSNSEISEGHCRALLSLESETAMIDLARDAVNNELSVRQVEDAVKKAKTPIPDKKPNKISFELPESVATAAQTLGISIRITGKESKRKLHIEGIQDELMMEVLKYIETQSKLHFPGNTSNSDEAIP